MYRNDSKLGIERTKALVGLLIDNFSSPSEMHRELFSHDTSADKDIKYHTYIQYLSRLTSKSNRGAPTAIGVPENFLNSLHREILNFAKANPSRFTSKLSQNGVNILKRSKILLDFEQYQIACRSLFSENMEATHLLKTFCELLADEKKLKLENLSISREGTVSASLHSKVESFSQRYLSLVFKQRKQRPDLVEIGEEFERIEDDVKAYLEKRRRFNKVIIQKFLTDIITAAETLEDDHSKIEEKINDLCLKLDCSKDLSLEFKNCSTDLKEILSEFKKNTNESYPQLIMPFPSLDLLKALLFWVKNNDMQYL